MLLLSVFLLLLPSTDAHLFSKACLKETGNTFPVSCCPTYMGSPCGAAQNRGSCMPVRQSRTVPDPDIHLDDRHNFPSFFYNESCICKGNYMGDNCGECKPNFNGTNCEVNLMNVWKEARQSTPKEREQYNAKIHYCKSLIDPRYYILVAGNRFRSSTFRFIHADFYSVWCFDHYYITKPYINNTRETLITNGAHGSTAFLGWHRHFMLLFVWQIQRCLKDPTFSIMYYDWRNDQDCAICTNDLVGANDEMGYLSINSVFSNWRIVCGEFDYPTTYCLMSDCICERGRIIRQPGVVLGISKPTKADVDYCMNLNVLDRIPYNTASQSCFRGCIEGWWDRFERPRTSTHNAFHVWIGGTMAQVPISCNDLLFIYHHAFIDKCFENYILKWNITPASYPNNPIYGHRRDDCIGLDPQCHKNPEMFTTSKTFGYTYSEFQGF